MFAITVFSPSPERCKNNVFTFFAFNFMQSPGDLLLYMLTHQNIIVPGNIA